MKVVLAEKPSVARDLAGFLGARQRRDGYIEGDGVQVTWAFGHLVTLQEPQEYDPALKRWTIESLPILPEEFKLKLAGDAGARKQFEIVAGLMRAADELVCATDAGREGELIFRYIVEMSGCGAKPIRRLWLSSLTEVAIRAAFENARPGEDYEDLYAAARCRSEADWIVGMNATRGYTVRYGQSGVLWSVGRVQTPVLALIAQREDEIRHFESAPWWELRTRYRDVQFRLRGDRFGKEDDAKAALAAVEGQVFTVRSVETRDEQLQPPQLFDLTALQREMNLRVGLSAQRTLEQAQALYEKKLVTYPRTDSRYLTSDMQGGVPALMQHLAARFPKEIAGLNLERLPGGGRIFNDAKVNDHHAIIPTGRVPDSIAEREVYDAIALRTIAAFYPVCRREITVVDGDAGPLGFRARGVRVVDPGWTAVKGAQAPPKKPKKGKAKDDGDTDAEQELPAFEVGEHGPHVPEVKHGETRPPRHYTENSLLGAMETAGKLVDDDELKEALKARGLGTPATRAAIIETLLRRRYVERDKKALRITELGRYLVALIQDPILKSAEMTGEWEAKLDAIARGASSREAFMQEIRDFAVQLIANSDRDRVDYGRIGDCPRCAAALVEGNRGYGCSAWKDGCEFVLWKDYRGHTISPMQAAELFQRCISLRPVHLEGSQRALCLTKGGQIFDLGMPTRDQQRGELQGKRASRRGSNGAGISKGVRAPAAAKKRTPKPSTSVACPLCAAGLVERPADYACAKTSGAGCTFAIPKQVAGKKISKAMVKKLITKKQTQVLKGFVSPRSGRKFDAALRLQPDGRIAFEAVGGSDG